LKFHLLVEQNESNYSNILVVFKILFQKVVQKFAKIELRPFKYGKPGSFG
jgi:hypothetical protein